MTQTIRCPKEDLRQKRTRHLLVQALVALLEERSFFLLSVGGHLPTRHGPPHDFLCPF